MSTIQAVSSSGIFAVARKYPIPVFALTGLAAGGVAYLIPGGSSFAGWIWFATLVVGGAPVVLRTIGGVLRGKFAADIVAMLAIIAAVLMDEAFAGVIVVLMQTGGEAMEDYGFSRASSSLLALLARAPKSARRKRNDTIEEIDVKGVAVGDILVVRQGDLIPVDGSVAKGPAEIDESALTGEPLPRLKHEGDPLLSGSVNVGPVFEMGAKRVSSESEYSRIVDLVRRAQEVKPPIQRLADRYAIWFTPTTILVAVFGWFLTNSVDTILAVLVVATPCPLILATPLAVMSGVNKAAKENIIVKSGAAIEQIGRCRVVIFDKTGTITYGKPVIQKLVVFSGDEEEILRKVASIEQYSTHPVAASLAQEGRERFGELLPVTDVRETPGHGVEADVNAGHYFVGSQRYVEEKIGREFDGRAKEVVRNAQKTGSLVSFIADGKEPLGIVVFSDKLRPGVPSMIQGLRDLGVEHTLLLTGDNEVNASTVAEEAGIERAEANLLPAQKAAEVQRLTNEYQYTVMVGDGINDAPALATATVGVAMGAHGTGISAEAADVVLLVDEVTKVRDGIAIGQRTLRIAKQGIYLGIGASFVLMVIASFGYIQPAIGAIMQEVLDSAVILNALRAR